MTLCPFCGHTNIEGAEVCDSCQQSLNELKDAPATVVERSLLRDSVAELDPRTPVVVSPETTVRDVLKSLIEDGTGCALVADGDNLVGIFTERDCVQKLGANFGEALARPVSDFMTPEPQSLDPTAKVAFAVQRMDLGGYRHVPIVEEGTATSIISVRDILAYLTEKMQAN